MKFKKKTRKNSGRQPLHEAVKSRRLRGKIYEPNLERSYGYLKQWPSDYYKFWDARIIEVRFNLKMGYLNILGLYVSKKDETKKQKNFIKSKRIRSKINKICDILLMDVLRVDSTKNKRNKWRAKY